MPTTTIYVYFISFSHPGGFGNVTLDAPAPITHSRQIDALARLIAHQYNLPDGQVVILNYQLLRQQPT